MNSLDLVIATERESRELSFTPFVVQFARRILHPTKQALDALTENLDGHNGEIGCSRQTLKAIRVSMAPGTALDQMSQVMLRNLRNLIDISFEPESGPIDLYSQIRHVTTLASTYAVYGPKNPFQDPAVEEGLW